MGGWEGALNFATDSESLLPPGKKGKRKKPGLTTIPKGFETKGGIMPPSRREGGID